MAEVPVSVIAQTALCYPINNISCAECDRSKKRGAGMEEAMAS